MPGEDLSDKLQPLELQVRKTIQSHNMITPGEHVLAAVSGGADSVALLLCLCRLASDFNLSLTVAHLNHGLRGTESDGDEDSVRHICAEMKLPFYSETIPIKQKAEATGQNLEELARQTRYDFLRRTAQKSGAHKIAVGHTLNDQAETILFRFIRGSGIEGLSAIHPVVDGRIIRPLLECSRDQILLYLKQRGALYREDSTNQDVHYTRNRIRLELLPYLAKHFNPRMIGTLAREALLMREAWSYIEAEARRAFGNLECNRREGLAIRISGLLELHPVIQKEVLRQAIREWPGTLRGITTRHIDSVFSLCRSGSSGDQIRLPHGTCVIRQFDDLFFLRRPPAQPPSFIYALPVPGECHIPEAAMKIRAAITAPPDRRMVTERSFSRAYLEASLMPDVLKVRSREPGDRYGGPGHRKVKKMLIDGKIPLLQRLSLPMVVAKEHVIWVPGFKPARSWEVRSESRACVLLEMIPE